MTDWKRTLPCPIRDKHGNTIRTLDDARAYMIALESRRNGATGRKHWQAAGKGILAATENGNLDAVSQQLTLALLMDGLLDMRQDM